MPKNRFKQERKLASHGVYIFYRFYLEPESILELKFHLEKYFLYPILKDDLCMFFYYIAGAYVRNFVKEIF